MRSPFPNSFGHTIEEEDKRDEAAVVNLHKTLSTTAQVAHGEDNHTSSTCFINHVHDALSLNVYPSTNALGSSASSPPIDTLGVESGHRDEDAYPHCPIYIPSKARYDQKRTTMSTLMRDLVPFTLVVEPHEEESYTDMLNQLMLDFIQKYESTHDFLMNSKKISKQHDDGAITIATSAQTQAKDFPSTQTITDNESKKRSNVASSPPALSPCCACCNELTFLEEHARSFAKRTAQLYHHGYLFRPSRKVDAIGTHLHSSTDLTTASTNGRMASMSFTLSDVKALRSIFKVVVLPESNRGVSYARNYILQVLVPQQMVEFGVDHTGNIEELGIFSHLPSQTDSSATPNSVQTRSNTTKVFLSDSTLKSFELDPSLYQAIDNWKKNHTGDLPHAAQVSERTPSRASGPLSSPHSLYGYYWVMDDDIFNFFAVNTKTKQNERISARQMMREVEVRIRRLNGNLANATQSISNNGVAAACSLSARKGTSKNPIFTCKEDAFASNWKISPKTRMLCSSASLSTNCVPGPSQGHPNTSSSFNTSNLNSSVRPSTSPVEVKTKTTVLNVDNYPYVRLTACFSLEYSRFAFPYDETALAVNSYNNIACLFDYRLLHNPMRTFFFPSHATGGVRPDEETIEGIPADGPLDEEQAASNKTASSNSDKIYYRYHMPGSMLWYRFAVREDYDFTLQLIARGMYTLRFRSLSFEVPQMGKLRGGMTPYYRTCLHDIKKQNHRFVLQWPSVAQTWEKGRSSTARDDIRVRWDLLHPSRSRYPGAFLYLRDPIYPVQQAPSQLSTLLPHQAISKPAGEILFTTGSIGLQDETHISHKPSNTKRPRPLPSPEQDEENLRNETDSSGPRNVAHVVKDLAISSPDMSTQLGFGDCCTSGPKKTVHGDNTSRWKGYAIERWRDLKPEEAQALGLHLIPSEKLYAGQTVAVVPPLLSQQPSVVLATLITKVTNTDGDSESRWSAVVQRVREIPELTVSQCYEVPSQGLEKAAAAVDFFFSKLWSTNAAERPSVNFLDD